MLLLFFKDFNIGKFYGKSWKTKTEFNSYYY